MCGEGEDGRLATRGGNKGNKEEITKIRDKKIAAHLES